MGHVGNKRGARVLKKLSGREAEREERKRRGREARADMKSLGHLFLACVPGNPP